jgi:hypothetical protein
LKEALQLEALNASAKWRRFFFSSSSGASLLRQEGRQHFANQPAPINSALVCDRFQGPLLIRWNVCLYRSAESRMAHKWMILLYLQRGD